MSQFKFQILETRELPLDSIEPNPHNPRPVYHFNDEDLAGIANSINVEGQHLPAVVYEIAGKRGRYMLLQGERRWRSSQLAPNKKTLLCGIVRRPKSFAEELVWLGLEESFKQDWGTFSKLHLAHKLAIELNVPVTDPEVRNKLGISQHDARVADKIFRLEEQVWRLVEVYEGRVYESRQVHGDKGRAVGVHGQEYTAPKVAVVWDLYDLIRQTELGKRVYKNKIDLQMRLVTLAGCTSLQPLQNLANTVRDHVKNPSDQIALDLSVILENPEGRRQVERVIKKAGKANVADLATLVKRAEELQVLAKKVVANSSQIGSNPTTLMMASRVLRGAVGDLQDADHKIDRRLRTLTYEDR